jgi:hypothetical protein
MHRKRFSRNYAYAGTAEAKQLGIRAMWGGSDQPSQTIIQQPTPPASPTATQTANDYATALPIYYQSALQYEPQIAKMQQDIQSQLYPQTSGLQEQIAGQAAQGVSQDLPSWYKANVQDTLKSQLGRNLVYNPQAQESYGLQTQEAYKGWGDYWRNFALAAAGRQPLTQSNNMMQSYTPNAQMQNTAQNYNAYSGTYGQMYGANAGYANNQNNNALSQSQYNPWMNLAGSIAGGVGGAMTAKFMGGK